MIIDFNEKFLRLYHSWAGEPLTSVKALPQSGSYRRYFRLSGSKTGCIGVYGTDRKENSAFITFTNHFFKMGLPVPEVFAEDIDNDIYLIRDLGDISLYSLLQADSGIGFTHEMTGLYKKVIDELARFQINGGSGLDYSVCYPRESFDRQSMMWDLNYFKYYFAKLSGIQFDEQKLEDDFSELCDFLSEAGSSYFMYRDFQSRNIMIHKGSPYFIDYQGGRKGPLQYDLASLLYQAKADIPDTVRKALILHYFKAAGRLIPFDSELFMKYFPACVLIRIIQTLGAYGFRGFIEKKQYFIDSIPFAIKNLENVISEGTGLVLPEMLNVFRHSIQMYSDNVKPRIEGDLVVSISSFSYKTGIPADINGNGGGYVFDCRALNNPGRFDRYKELTGKDEDVIKFFLTESDVNDFLADVFRLVDYSVEKYLERGFNNLSVNFGCTGGRHRSVYCSEKLAEHLVQKYKIKITLNHTENESHDPGSRAGYSPETAY